MEQNLPPGFRFHPTDEELITFYLARKVKDFNFVTRAITNVDFNKCEPWDLPGKATMGEKEWYFFSLKDRKYPTGLRTNRATDAGYWKTTGKDKEIFHSGVLVGMKKTLVFYKGRAPKGEKSNWVMHEYRLQNKYPYTKDEWVVCRVFLKSSTNKRPSSPHQNLHASVHDSNSCDTHTLVSELGELDATNMGNLVSSSTGFNTCSISSNSMNTDMSWAIYGEATNMNPPLSWPSNYMLKSNPSANFNLIKPLQFGHCQVPDPGSTDINPLLMQASGILSSNMIGSSNSNTSSSKVINPVEQQSFHLDPIWRGC